MRIGIGGVNVTGFALNVAAIITVWPCRLPDFICTCTCMQYNFIGFKHMILRYIILTANFNRRYFAVSVY